MKLATFTEGHTTRVGVVKGDHVHDLASVAGLPTDMIALLSGGPALMNTIGATIDAGRRIPLSAVHLEAPVLNPRKFLAIGGNYEAHLQEVSHIMPRPEYQTW